MELAETEITDLDLFNAAIKYFERDRAKAASFCKNRFLDLGGNHIGIYNSLGSKLAIHFKDLERMVNERFPEDKGFLNVVKNMYENKEIWQQDADKAHSLRNAVFANHSE